MKLWTLAIDLSLTALFVLLFGNPHLLESALKIQIRSTLDIIHTINECQTHQRSKNRAPNPRAVTSLYRRVSAQNFKSHTLDIQTIL